MQEQIYASGTFVEHPTHGAGVVDKFANIPPVHRHHVYFDETTKQRRASGIHPAKQSQCVPTHMLTLLPIPTKPVHMVQRGGAPYKPKSEVNKEYCDFIVERLLVWGITAPIVAEARVHFADLTLDGKSYFNDTTFDGLTCMTTKCAGGLVRSGRIIARKSLQSGARYEFKARVTATVEEIQTSAEFCKQRGLYIYTEEAQQ